MKSVSFEGGGYGEGDLGDFDPIASSFLDRGNLAGYELYMKRKQGSDEQVDALTYLLAQRPNIEDPYSAIESE